MSASAPNSPFPRIAILGSGAVGCYYGGRLVQHGCDVRFLMRRDLEYVRRHGLVIKSPRGDFSLPRVQAFGNTAEIGAVDLVIITLKATANGDLDALIPPLLHEHTRLLTLQNGLGNEEFLAARWGADRVLGGACFTCINRTEPGRIEHLAQGQIAMGPHTPASRLAAMDAAALFDRCSIQCEFSESVPAVRWKKLVWNIPFNGLAILGGGIHTAQILADPALHRLVRSLMREVIAISCQLGYPLPESFIDNQIEATETMSTYRPSSMIDFTEGRDVEVEAIWGEPWRRAVAAGAEAGRLEMLYHLIRRSVDGKRAAEKSPAERQND